MLPVKQEEDGEPSGPLPAQQPSSASDVVRVFLVYTREGGHFLPSGEGVVVCVKSSLHSPSWHIPAVQSVSSVQPEKYSVLKGS